MGVLCDLTDQGLAICVGHPIGGLDLVLGVDDCLKSLLRGHDPENITNERSFVMAREAIPDQLSKEPTSSPLR
jgi:hypothetical protein